MDTRENFEYKEESIALFHELSKQFTFFQGQDALSGQKLLKRPGRTKLTAEEFDEYVCDSQMVPLYGTNLIVNSRVVDHLSDPSSTSMSQCMSLYSIDRQGAGSTLKTEKFPQEDCRMTDLRFNSRRNFLAGLSGFGTKYHLWTPCDSALRLLRKTKYNDDESGPHDDRYIRSLDFTADGELIATLSESNLLTISTVNKNEPRFTIDVVKTPIVQLQGSTCRWSPASGQNSIFVTGGPWFSSLYLIDCESGEIVYKTWSRANYESVEVSETDPTVMAVLNTGEKKIEIYDTRMDPYPVFYAPYGLPKNRERKAKLAKDVDLTFEVLKSSEHPIRYPLQWSKADPNELLSISDFDVVTIDIRNQKLRQIIENDGYSAACYFNL